MQEANFSFAQFNRIRNHFLDAGWRLDGIPALGPWDLNHDRTGRPAVNKREACSPPHTTHKRKQSQRVINDLDDVDFIPSNVQSSISLGSFVVCV